MCNRTHCNTCITLQTHCNTPHHIMSLQSLELSSHVHSKTHCNTCNTLQHTATHCNASRVSRAMWYRVMCKLKKTLRHTAHTLQHTATHCITLQRNATHCNTLQHRAKDCNTLHHIATHSSLQSLRLISENADNAFSGYQASKRTHSWVSSNSENAFSATKQAREHILGYQAIQRIRSRAIKSRYQVAAIKTTRWLRLVGSLKL